MKNILMIFLAMCGFGKAFAQTSAFYNDKYELFVDHLYPIDNDVLTLWITIEPEVAEIFREEIRYPAPLVKFGIMGMCIVGLDMVDGKLQKPNLTQCIGGGADEAVISAVMNRHDDLEALLRRIDMQNFSVYVPILFNLKKDKIPEHAINITP